MRFKASNNGTVTFTEIVHGVPVEFRFFVYRTGCGYNLFADGKRIGKVQQTEHGDWPWVATTDTADAQYGGTTFWHAVDAMLSMTR